MVAETSKAFTAVRIHCKVFSLSHSIEIVKITNILKNLASFSFKFVMFLNPYKYISLFYSEGKFSINFSSNFLDV
jgi:hypothetical protein